jgi:hypothetical protein
MKTTSEGSRGHHTMADPKGLQGGASWLHLGATRSLAVAPASQLLDCSSTTSLDCIYAVLQVGLIQGLMLDSLAI